MKINQSQDGVTTWVRLIASERLHDVWWRTASTVAVVAWTYGRISPGWSATDDKSVELSEALNDDASAA